MKFKKKILELVYDSELKVKVAGIELLFETCKVLSPEE